MAWVAYAGMGYTLLKGQHMQLGAVYDRLHGRIKHIFSFFIYLLATNPVCCHDQSVLGPVLGLLAGSKRSRWPP